MLIVTATNLPRFIACNGSISMGDSESPIESDNAVRDEGNAAHWIAEQKFYGKFQPEELVDRKSPDGVYITGEMIEYLDEYLSTIGTHESPAHFVEHALVLYGQNWQINGRADNLIYDADKKHLSVNDLKFGWSIVEPEMNWTLLAYLFGFMGAYPGAPIESATLTIFQPRPYHPSGTKRSWSISKTEIIELWNVLCNTMVAPDNILNTGSHCRRCPALVSCPAARKAEMNGIEASEIAFVDSIDNTVLAFRLDHLNRALEHLKGMEKAYSELALHRLKQGQVIQNYSLHTELTNRNWKEYITPEILLGLTGQDLTKNKLITPAQAEKAGVAKEVIASMTERHQKGVKLVRIDANVKAQQLFKKG